MLLVSPKKQIATRVLTKKEQIIVRCYTAVKAELGIIAACNFKNPSSGWAKAVAQIPFADLDVRSGCVSTKYFTYRLVDSDSSNNAQHWVLNRPLQIEE